MILANLSGRRFSRSMIKTTMQKREQALRLLKTGALVAGSIAATNCWAVSVVNQITLLDAESGRELRASKIKYGQKILVRVARDVAGATSMTACRIVLTDSAGNEMMNLLDRTSCKPGVYTSGPMPFLYEFGQTYRVKSTFNYVYNDIFLIVPHPRKKPSSNSVEFALPALGGTATVAQDGRRVTATASLSPAGAALQVFEGPKLLASTTSDADGKAEVTTAELAAGNHALTFKAVAGEYAETLLEQPFQIYVPPPRLELNWAFPKKDAALVDRVISLRGETIVENASLAADALEFWLKPPGDAWIEHHHRPFACPVNTHENTFACQTALSDEAWNKPFVDIKLHLETSASTPIKTNEARRFLIRRPASELLKIAPLQIVVPGDAAASGKRHRPGSAIHYRLVFTALHDLGAFDVNFPLAKHLANAGAPTLNWIRHQGNGTVKVDSGWPASKWILHGVDAGGSTADDALYQPAMQAGDSFSLEIPLAIANDAAGVLRSELTVESAHFLTPVTLDTDLDVVPARVILDEEFLDRWHGSTLNVSGMVEHPYGSGIDALGTNAVHIWSKPPSAAWTDAPQAICSLQIDKQAGSFNCPLSLDTPFFAGADRADIRVRIKGRDGYLSAPAEGTVRVDVTGPSLTDIALTPRFDANQSLLVTGSAADAQSGLGVSVAPNRSIEVLWSDTDTATRCPVGPLDDGAAAAWSTARRTGCDVANGRFSCALRLGADWLSSTAAVCIRAKDRVGNTSTIWRRADSHLPSARALAISLSADDDTHTDASANAHANQSAEQFSQASTARSSSALPPRAPGTSFVLRLHAEIKPWDLRAAKLTLRLPAVLTADGALRVERSAASKLSASDGGADGPPLAALPSVNLSWTGNDQSSLLAANTNLQRQSAFDLLVPVRVRPDAAGGSVLLHAHASAENLDSPIVTEARVAFAVPTPSTDKLRIIASVDPKHAAPGDAVEYQIEYLNASNETLTDVSIKEPVPAHTRYIEGSARCVEPVPQGANCQAAAPQPGEAKTVQWAIDRLDANQSGKLSFSTRIESSDQ